LLRVIAIPSLRWRLVAVMCLAYIVVAVTTSYVGYRTQEAGLRHQLELRASADARLLAAGAAPVLSNAFASRQEKGALGTFVKSFRKVQGVGSATIYGPNYCARYSTLPVLPPCDLSLAGQPQTSVLRNGDEEVVYPIGNAPPPIGTAVVILSDSTAQNDLRSNLITDSILRAIGLLIFIILSLAIAQYFLGPLTALARAADAIRHGRLSTRVSVEGGSELSVVGAAFNDMAGALEQRIHHLSFLARSGSVLPGSFRQGENVDVVLAELCTELQAAGVALIPQPHVDLPARWFDANPERQSWRKAVSAVGEEFAEPTALILQDSAVMVVPVLGNSIFAVARDDTRPFTQEEQQVITNFAHQFGIAADNARLLEAQQEALQVKDQFLSIVSHELRTPLTTIKGYAQMLRRKLADDPDGQRFAVNIDTQVSRLSRLVDDLLDVTRFSRGQFELRRHRVDLRPLLEDIVARFQIVAPGHELRLELDHGPFEGYWDRDRLEQVMNNLVSNAIKYSPEGGVVAVGTRHDNGTLTVSVRDQGIGIREEDQNRLFERFYRARDKSQEVSGLGLGLYVTRRIVEAHGGSISVHSKPGEGSEFAFTLPLVRRAATVGR